MRLQRSVVQAVLSSVIASLLVFHSADAEAALTISKLTWNVIGLDSNGPTTGPRDFPVGARVCSDVAMTNVVATFVWDSANPYIALRPGTLSSINIPSIAAGGCADAYFEVEVTPTPAAFDTTRRYHITATDSTGTATTPVPRELYVEHLISQNRNSINSVQYGPNAASLTSVPAGGALNLVVGNTYAIRVNGGTATQGYAQFEQVINFDNTIFQVLGVTTSYSADDSPYVPNPDDKLYADACRWENDPNSPNYLACVGGAFKAGGSNVATTYTVRIVSGGGTTQTLNTLLYDFSGSSFHYNADFTTGARLANIIDPAAASLAKAFQPNPASLNGVSVLTITITNPNAGAVSGYNVRDNLPANLVVASTPAATTSGCGAPTLTATAGASSISFANGTVAANSNCVIKVNVTPTATGTLTNTTDHLFVDTTDTGKSATATLTVNNAPAAGAGLCGLTLARWNFPTGMSTTNPAPSIANVTASSAAGAGLSPQFSSSDNTITPSGTGSWSSNGAVATGAVLNTANNDYFQFAIDTTGYSAVNLSFDALYRSGNGPKGIAVYYGLSSARPESGTSVYSNATAISAQNTWVSFGGGGSLAFTSGLNPSGLTYFRIYSFNAGNSNPGADPNIDNVLFTGCGAAAQPTIAKTFSPASIAVNGVSTLTFTLTNPNGAPLTGATFRDALPAGLQVAATPAATTTCGGSPTFAPTAGATTIAFGQTTGATIPAGGLCTASVNVTATTTGPHANASGNLSTTESGTNTSSVGTATLTALAPPSIAKQFAPSPVLPGRTSTLTFTITNPNPADAIGSVAFNDSFPTTPGAMTVAAAPSATTSGCGAPTFAPAAGAGSISFSGGTIAPGSTCVVTVAVTAPATGTYNNTSSAISYVINAQTVTGNTAGAALTVNPPHPSIGLLKEISQSSGGPWLSYQAVTTGPVYYRFTVENSGDVPLTAISISDDTLDVASCNASFASLTLPVAVAANDNHIVTCTAGPVATAFGSHTNTAHANGADNVTAYRSPDSSATYATTALSLAKTSTETTYTSAGDTIHYSYTVTNSGFATLAGPVTVSDDHASVTCPSLTTTGDGDAFFDAGETLVCTATYAITASDVSSAFVTNTATATADSVTSPAANRTVVVSTAADVSLSKTLTTAGPFSAGQPVTYTLAVANTGPATATSVQVTDTPTNLTITSVSGGGCATLPCTIASIASGSSVTINVMAIVTAAGAFDNSATASAVEADPNAANNSDSSGNGGTAAAGADVSLVKTLTTAGPYTVGQSIAYTIGVGNAGPSTATSVMITDTPTNLTITSVSGGGCAALPCTIASITSGNSVTINVTATIIAAGAFDNSATATGVEADPTLGNNSDSTANGGSASASADVSLVKTLTTTAPFAVGGSVNYTLVVANAGPSTATTVQVTDTPTNLTITSVRGGGCSALPCTIASIASGGSVTINVTATLTAAGAFDNSATATGVEADPTPANNSDSTGNGGSASASADVSLVKTLTTAGPFTVGGSVNYTLVVANAGPSTATTVQVTDTPTNLAITGVSGGGCSALPCTIASIASGGSVTINVTATITAAGAFDNSATATGVEADPTPANNSDSTGNGGSAAASADVSLVKTLTTAGPYSTGQSLSYTLVVANAGPSTATTVQVTDTPTNLTIIGVSGGGCSALPCTIASIVSGGTVTINVTATLTAAGAFDNSATATGVEADPTLANNSDSTGNGGSAAASADVSLVKTLTAAGPYSAGQSLSYTLVVANAGPSTATTVQVTDTPTNLTITSVSGAGCSALPCTIPSIVSGGSVTINVTATITAAGAFDNSGSASATEPDPNTTNNSDENGNGGVTAGVPSADASLVKTLTTAAPFTIGGSVSYTLVVANAGPLTATMVQVTDTPTDLTITGVSGGGCASLPCTIASIASGNSVTINVMATITAAGAFDNSATASAAEADPNVGNNTDSIGNGGSAAASADVSLVKTLTTAAPFTIGGTVNYTLVVANAGPSTATTVQVTDTPTNLTITGVSGGGCASLPCTIVSIASGSSVTINVTATITAAGAFDNSATATGVEADPTLANNSDSTGNGGSASASADVSLVKTLTTAGPYSTGQSVSYTLVVANAGPSTATTVQVTDTPTNLTITSVSGAGCAALPCTIASIVSGGIVTINVTATLTAAGAFDNSATATGVEADPTLGNNSDSTGNGGSASASADVSLVKTLTTAGPYSTGQSLSYTLVVANAGPSTATSVMVTDTPTNLTITTVSGGGCGTLPCTIAGIASGSSITIDVTATITTAGPFDNGGSASATEPDPNTTNNSDENGNGGVTAGVPSADVSLVKTLTTAAPFTVGSSVSYTLVIANAGPSTATTVQVTDTPTNLTITGVSGGGCAALPCTIASIVSGGSVTVNVTATITAAGAFDNSATATGVEADPSLANNSDSAGNGGSAAASADVSLVKTLTTAGPYSAGQSLSYTLVVTNAGPSTATSVMVTDTPTNLTITTVSGGGCSALPCTIAGIASGSSITIDVTATITTAGPFDNGGSASATEPDPNTTNDSDENGNGGVTAGVPSADVSLVKTLTTAAPFTVGSSVSYTLVIANAGPSTATTVQVTDTPTNLTITGVSGGGCAALPCTIASIASGSSVTLNVMAMITAAGAFDNSATATAAEADPNLASNSDAGGNGGTANAASATVDLSVLKTASTSSVAVGQLLTYTLMLHNNGPNTATGVTVADTLPPNFVLASATSSQGSCSGSATITCALGTMAAASNATITIQGHVTAGATLSNTATITANEIDGSPANNSSTIAVTVTGTTEDIPTASPAALLLLALSLAVIALLLIRR